MMNDKSKKKETVLRTEGQEAVPPVTEVRKETRRQRLRRRYFYFLILLIIVMAILVFAELVHLFFSLGNKS